MSAPAKKVGKARIIKRVFFIFGLIMSIVIGSIIAVAKHNADKLFDFMNYDDNGTLEKVDVSKYDTVSDNEIINILLVGADKDPNEQNKGTAEKRSDSMMIATLDMKHKKLKLTSLMRDMYVEIPGHPSHKLNSSYNWGGIKLLYETTVKNFGIKPDGYVEVNFDAFVDVIDAIGGVEANLTESEAYNLNDTNYIKRKKYRNVKEGNQILNGYQTLGYCRIRHGKMKNGHMAAVLTASGKGDDYGRTERQRLVMQAILKKIKSMPLDKWMKLVEVIMPNIKTDLSKDEIYSYIMAIIKMGTTELNQFALPVEGGFTSQTVGGMEVLVPDIAKNKDALKTFIYKK